jgi:hypothetical protein
MCSQRVVASDQNLQSYRDSNRLSSYPSKFQESESD